MKWNQNLFYEGSGSEGNNEIKLFQDFFIEGGWGGPAEPEGFTQTCPARTHSKNQRVLDVRRCRGLVGPTLS